MRFCGECGTPLGTEPTPARAPTIAPTPATPPVFAGGRYEVRRFLGEGGKKRVYLVHDARLDRDVAFSLIKTEGMDPVGVERVQREAQLMGRLGGHPHIVSVFDMGEEAGQPFLVSELMRGGDVEGLIASAPDHRPPLETTLRIAEQICQALEYAHERGIVHRDLKPGNVWLSADGVAKLGDFGLAMALDRTRLSIAGMIVGTVAYMPPEQAMGRLPDARSDLYSLGAMLYEMVTGRPPFLGDDPVGVISQHLNTAPVAPSWHNPKTPKPLEALILRLLAKNPDERPATAAEVRADLSRIAAVVADPASSDSTQFVAANPLDRLAGGVFVGRERELAELRAGLDAALSGRSQVLLLAGDPGIGKTRLAEELATYAALRGAQVLWGRCYEWEGAPAYWPWMQIIRGYVHTRDPQGLRSELGSGASDIAQVVSEVRERLPDVPAPPAMEPEQARFRLFDSIANFLRNASTHQPLVFILDDLHWADRSSLLLLEFLTRELREGRLLLVGTYRDADVGRRHPLSQTLAELSRERRSRRIVLRGLQREDVAQFITLSAGVMPPEGLAEAVHQETEGNPFFVAEVVRLLVAEGRFDQPLGGRSWSVSIPESVREVIGKRLSRLGDECNRVLAIGSVVGREFRLTTLERITGLPPDTLLDLLEEAVRGRVVEEQDVVGQFRFSHTLIQETLYGELSTARRVRLHGQVGDAIEALQAANLMSYVGELAQHYFQSAAAGNADKAIHYAVEAAERSMAQVAWEAAAGHYQRALQALDLKQPPDDLQRGELLLALGTAQWSMGDSEAAQASYRQAADMVRRLRRPDLLAKAAYGYAGGGIVTVYYPEEATATLLQEALDALGPGDSIQRVQLLCELAAFLPQTADSRARSRAIADEALMIANRIGDVPTRILAVRAKWREFEGLEYEDERLALAIDLIHLSERAGDRRSLVEGHAFRAIHQFDVGDIQSAERDVAAATRVIEELRLPNYEVFVLMYATLRALMAGRYTVADDLIDQALVLGRRAWPGAYAEVNIAPYQYLLYRERRQFDRCETLLRNVSDRDPERTAYWRIQAVLLCCDLGQIDAARVGFDALAAQSFADISHDDFWLAHLALLGEVAAALGDGARAGTLYDYLAPYADHAIGMGTNWMWHGSASYYLGLLATTLARWDDAEVHFQRAAVMNAGMGAAAFVTISQYARSEMLVRRGRPEDQELALDLAGQALAAAENLGMQRIAGLALALKVRVQGILKA